MSARKLTEIRRRVPLALMRQYDESWEALRAGVQAHGAHAWRFRSSHEALEFVEFVEHGDGQEPLSRPEVKEMLKEMDRIAPGVAEEFVEASPQQKSG